MSAQEPPNFTPAQILEAGHRAAGDGRIDVARQFYHHVIATAPGTAEAQSAGQALEHLRLDYPPVLAEPGRLGPPDPGMAQTVLPAPAVPAPPALNGWHHPASLAPPAPVEDHHPAIPVPLPEPARDYRTGRVLARLTAWSGGALALAGIALLPLAMLGPRVWSGIPLLRSLEPGALSALALVVLGLGLVMLGQLVRALLDHANAARDLAALQRAQASARPKRGHR